MKWENWIGKNSARLNPLLLREKADKNSPFLTVEGKPVGLLPGQGFEYLEQPSENSDFVKIRMAILEKIYTGYVDKRFLKPLRYKTRDYAEGNLPWPYRISMFGLTSRRPAWKFEFPRFDEFESKLHETMENEHRIHEYFPLYYLGGDGQASREVAAFFLDPKNGVDESHIFQFVKLSDSAGRSPEELKTGTIKILKDFYLFGKNIVTPFGLIRFEDLLMKTAEKIGINPVLLAAILKASCGRNGSDATSGFYQTTSGKRFEGIYNFFMVGAENYKEKSKRNEAALFYAEENDWINPYVSLTEGAKHLFSQLRRESTLYSLQFSAVPVTSSVSFPYELAACIFKILDEENLLDAEWSFSIPHYQYGAGKQEEELTHNLPDFNDGDAYGNRRGKITGDVWCVSALDYDILINYIKQLKAYPPYAPPDYKSMDLVEDGAVDAFDAAVMDRILQESKQKEVENGTVSQNKPMEGVDGIEIGTFDRPDKDAVVVWSLDGPYATALLPTDQPMQRIDTWSRSSEAVKQGLSSSSSLYNDGWIDLDTGKPEEPEPPKPQGGMEIGTEFRPDKAAVVIW